mgnify:CR=1 FL=1
MIGSPASEAEAWAQCRRGRWVGGTTRFQPRFLHSHSSLVPPPRPPQVEGNEEVTAVTTAEQREAFIGQLNDEEDWLYGDGEAAETAELK